MNPPGTKEKPTVLHIIQALRGGGAQTFLRELVPLLTARGFDNDVLCAYGSSELTNSEAKNWPGKIYNQQRVGVSRLRYLSQMRGLIRHVSPDIVHTHTHVGATWGRAAALLERVPIIVHTEHGYTQDGLPALQRAAHKVLNPRTTAIVTFSDRTAMLVRRRESIRDVYVIPNGIRIHPLPTEAQCCDARKKLAIDESRIVIGIIANLHAYKNPEIVIDAIADVPEQLRKAILVAFFGEGELRDVLSAKATRLGLDDSVRFYGFRTDIEELLPGVDLVVTMSALEMMPISLLEAMNAAIPIIGAPHAGTLDLVVDGHTGIILKSWSPKELAHAIEWAAARPEWRRQAGLAGHQRLKANFDIEAVADRYVTLYQQLLAAQSGKKRQRPAPRKS